MDQSHPSGDQTHEGRFIQHGIARAQLLVEPGEGVRGHISAVEERGGGIDLCKDILRAMDDLSTCSETFSELVGKVQAAVRTPFPSSLSPQG